jgi:hypothetical protein
MKVIDAFLEKANAPQTIKKRDMLLVVLQFIGRIQEPPFCMFGCCRPRWKTKH